MTTERTKLNCELAFGFVLASPEAAPLTPSSSFSNCAVLLGPGPLPWVPLLLSPPPPPRMLEASRPLHSFPSSHRLAKPGVGVGNERAWGCWSWPEERPNRETGTAAVKAPNGFNPGEPPTLGQEKPRKQTVLWGVGRLGGGRGPSASDGAACWCVGGFGVRGVTLLY